MQFNDARKQRDPLDGKVHSIAATVNGENAVIPICEGNSHYKELMRQVAEEGLIIQEPEE